jgi:hypothetical protein
MTQPRNATWLVVLLLTSCQGTPIKLYDGPERGYESLALVSTLSASRGAFLAAVDGRAMKTLADGAPPFVLLDPGVHTLDIRYEDQADMPVFLRLAKGQFQATLEAGHTYLVHYELVTVDGQVRVRLGTLDVGTHFPKPCLPIVLVAGHQERGEPLTWTKDEVETCARHANSRPLAG